MINGVVARKLAQMDTALAELRSLGRIGADDIATKWMLRRSIERDLQVLAEILIDVCQRLIALAGRAPETSAVACIEAAHQLGALADAGRYTQIVRFRNFVVHHYDRVDAAVLAEIVNDRLEDFDRFREEVMAYVARED